MKETIPVQDKLKEVEDEMKVLGLWMKEQPQWVTRFDVNEIASQRDFTQWLQFVYLPNCIYKSSVAGKTYIVPQAMKFFGEDVKKGKLLQLLIELDSL